MPEKLLTLTLRSDINEIPRLSTELHTLMQDHGFPEEDILDTQLAVEEAVTNIIMHGYKDGNGSVLVLCRANTGTIEIRLEDRAVPFNPLTLPSPDLDEDIEDRKIGGLGFFLIRQVMDEILYRYEDGKNILTMIKRKTD
jgi:serine/threonine-protein kinase RsbW